MSLLKRLKSVSNIKETSVLSESDLFNEKDLIQTDVPLINLALSGEFDGGLVPGVTMLCGLSKSFKTGYALVMASAYLNKYEDAVMVLVDSEFGAPLDYFRANGISTDRVLHIPVVDLEEMRTELTNQVNEIKRGDKVIFVVDSIGNIASKKEADDAAEGKSAGDFTRAKMIKSMFRIATSHLSKKDIPMIVINHTYASMSLYPTEIVSGGRGSYYAADNIWIISRSQEKAGTELIGYNFTINIEKSRFVKEKSKLPVQVTFDGGINKYSGLLDLALEFGHVVKPKNGWYALVDETTGELSAKNYREAQTQCEEVLGVVLGRESFRKQCKEKYKLLYTKPPMTPEDIDGELADAAAIEDATDED